MKSGGFHVKSKDLLQGIVTLCLWYLHRLSNRTVDLHGNIYTLHNGWQKLQCDHGVDNFRYTNTHHLFPRDLQFNKTIF